MRHIIVLVLIFVLSAVSVHAQERRPSVDLGIGFTLAPETFLFGGNFQYPLVSNLSFGPLLQVGVGSDDTLVGISGNFRYSFILAEVQRLVPSLEAGAGVLVADQDDSGDDDDSDSSTGFLIALGGGMDYMFTDNFGAGSHIYFNPAFGGDEDFFFSWFFGIKFNL